MGKHYVSFIKHVQYQSLIWKGGLDPYGFILMKLGFHFNQSDAEPVNNQRGHAVGLNLPGDKELIGRSLTAVLLNPVKVFK